MEVRMKGKFISLVAVAALVGSIASVSIPSTASAGTVATKGNTAVTMYGFINYTAGWTKKMGGTSAGFTNMPNEATLNGKVNFASTAKCTRLGLKFANKDANLYGIIEADFAISGNTRLRRAFVKHQFNNFYVLVGREWGIEEAHTFSTSWKAPAGFNGNGNRMPQVRIGTNLDLNGAALNMELAFEDMNYSAGVKTNRRTIPNIATKATVKFDTGFGKPARIYAFGTLNPIKIESPTDTTKEKGKTPYVFGTGFSLPVSMVTLQSEYIHTKGATGFSGLTSSVPPSYVTDGTSDKATKSDAWNIEAKIAPMKNLSLAAGYDFVKFKNATWDNNRKVSTILGNAVFKTTKYTKLSFEWMHVKSEHFEAKTQKGNVFFFRYFYNF
jgi:hypothetical protein